MKISKKVQENVKNWHGISLMINWCKENLEDEQPIEMMIAYAAEKFGYELKNFSHSTMTKLNSFIISKGIGTGEITHCLVEEPVMEITTVGIITLAHNWLQYQYDGVFVNDRPTTILYINGNEYESKFLDEKQLEELKDILSTLFDEEISRKIHPLYKVEALYSVFLSPRMTNHISGYNKLMGAVSTLERYQDMPEANVREDKMNACSKVINMYLEYLWEKHEKKADLKYVYSFESWIDKNKHLWGEDLSTPTESLNLFMEEHQSVIDIFNGLKEPRLTYKIKWLKEAENLYRKGSQEEIILNGLDGM